METIIYIRTSTEEQEPQLQIADCNRIAVKLGLTDCIVISDKQSAWKDTEREGFERITQAIKKREVKNLICWDLDRLYRNRKKLIAFFEFCKLYNCKIYSVRQEWLESLNKIPEPFGEMMFNLMLQVMGWLSEEESNKKSMRVKNAVVKVQGITKSYKGNKWGRKALSKNVVNQILQLHNQGLSIRQIAKQVYYYDKSNNKRQVSVAVVHKTITANSS